MPLPMHHDLYIEILTYLTDKDQAIQKRKLMQPLAEKFNLTDEDLLEMYPSGNGPIFKDRISWSLSYLNMAGLLERPRQGYYAISDTGRELLNKPDEIKDYVIKKVRARGTNQSQDTISDSSNTLATDTESGLTPQEQLYNSFAEIRLNIYDEIIETILSKSPKDFEKLVVQLLQKMGYGDKIENSGLVTQYTNDGGIDGIIKEDVLGLGSIHIQAKRYSVGNNIGRQEIQNFVGALAGVQSNKGIFITTSAYTGGALEYAGSLNAGTNVVLIDGLQLAKYIYDYGLGMQVEQSFEIKKLDSDFWDAMQDEG